METLKFFGQSPETYLYIYYIYNKYMYIYHLFQKYYYLLFQKHLLFQK